MRVALVSRELYPLGGGGIGQFVAAAARLLSQIAEVTVLTTSLFEETYERLRADRDPRLLGEDVRVVFVPEPTVEEAGGWYHVMHCYGARLLESLKECYPDGGSRADRVPGLPRRGIRHAPGCRDPRPVPSRDPPVRAGAHDGRNLRGARRLLQARPRIAGVARDGALCAGPLRSSDLAGRRRARHLPAVLRRGTARSGTRIRYPYAGPVDDGATDDAFAVEGPLRILYAGRLERRKGVHNLIRAITGIDRDDFRLTLIGGDTETAPLGLSMREQLELAIADDARIELHDPLDRAAVARGDREHHVVVDPLAVGVLAIRGARADPPQPPDPRDPRRRPGGAGRAGTQRLAGGRLRTTSRSSRRWSRVMGATAQLEQLVRSRSPLARGRELSDEREILDGYQSLARAPLTRRVWSAAPVAPPRRWSRRSFRTTAASRYVREAVQSLLAQTYPRLELVLVNDGSFEEEDWIVAELAARVPVTVVTQMNQGLGAARNFGVLQSRGRYVFPLDCDNIAEPEFVARCVEILERRPEVAYVTSWSRYIEDDGTPRAGPSVGYQPLGNRASAGGPGERRRRRRSRDPAADLRRRLSLQRGADLVRGLGALPPAARCGALRGGDPGAPDSATGSAPTRCRQSSRSPDASGSRARSRR